MYSLSSNAFHSSVVPTERALSLLALSHTTVEQQIYTAMFNHATATQTFISAFGVQKLGRLTGVRNAAEIRQALEGLQSKLSIEEHRPNTKVKTNASETKTKKTSQSARIFQVFHPEEIFARRYVATLQSGVTFPQMMTKSPQIFSPTNENDNLNLAFGNIIKRHSISCREAQVAMSCIEGLTNGEIGRRLHISEQTVKFHLRNIFTKCGVKRRAELVSHFLLHTHHATHTEQAEAI